MKAPSYCAKCGKPLRKRNEIYVPTALYHSKYNWNKLCKECFEEERKELNAGLDNQTALNVVDNIE